MRRWQPEHAWRRRADINSLGLAVLLVLIAGLFAFNQDTASDIQDSRVDFVRQSCVAQNERNVATIRRLDQLIADLPPGSRQRRAVTNRASTVALIDALAPQRDCDRVVARVELDD